ncbi:MAG: arylsulfatase, partial [Deltaproteobacteria bacterium]|nr:arylsulfatase [Deltaproteobacteria bacterium]
AQGVLLSQGGIAGGFSLFLKDRRLHYVHNYVGALELHVESEVDVPEGERELRFEFEPTGEPDIARGRGAPGRAQLYVDGVLVGQADFLVTIPLTLGLGEGLSCGRDPGSPVTSRYRPPVPFTGTLERVVVDVSGDLIVDTDKEMQAAMARQ